MRRVFEHGNENHLVEIAARIDLGGCFGGYGEGDQRLRFEYDHMGRRIRKTVESYNGSSWDVDTHRYFVYEPLRWNVLLVLDAADGSDQAPSPTTRSCARTPGAST